MKLPQPKSQNLDSPREVLRTRLHELEKILQNDFADRFCRDAIQKEANEVRQEIVNQLLPFEINPADKLVDTLEDEKIDESIEELSHQTIVESTLWTENVIKKIQARPDYREALHSYRFDNQGILKELLPGLGYYRADNAPREDNLFYASLLSTDFWDNVHQDSAELIRANLRRKLTELYSSSQVMLPTTPDQYMSLPGLDPVICSQRPQATPGILAIPFIKNPQYSIWSDRSDVSDYVAGQQIVSARFKVPIFKNIPLVLKDASAYYGTADVPAIYGDLREEDFSRIFTNIQKVLSEQNITYTVLSFT